MKKMVEQYGRRRRLVLQAFADMGLPCFEPRGAFYAFPDIRDTGLTSEEFAEELLKEALVAVVPGNAFGQQGEGFIRCSYAASIDELNEAFRRMGDFLKRLRGRKKVLTTSFSKQVQGGVAGLDN
jgi:aminotransferase